MNVAFTITDRVDDMTRGFLSSLSRHNDCKILLNVVDSETPEMDLAWRARLLTLPREEWTGQRMFRKVSRLLSMPFADGDKVLVLDTDLIVQGEVFGAMEGADIFVTTRHYPYWYVCNGGVWGFICNSRTRRFLDFFAQQVRQPTWEPFREFQSKWRHLGNLDWWCDQDMLCVIHGHENPVGAKVKDLGPRHNWCPSVEESDPGTFSAARADILDKVGNPEYKVLHFKGRLKEVYRKEVYRKEAYK